MTIQQRLPPGKYRLSVEDYVGLAESGAFGDARTELIDGEIIVMAPEYRPHAFVREEIAYRLRTALEQAGSALSVTSGSVRVTEHDMPQPDIVVTSEPRGEGPIPGRSVRLLIEVSATTLDQDLGEKAQLYAAAGIPEYWVVDVEGRIVHQLWQPQAGAYGVSSAIVFGDAISAKSVGGLLVTLPAG